MKTAVHQYEDKLLEFAYGELPAHEASAVDAHVRGCARCTQALEEIRSVRSAMSQLPLSPAPDAGLESLLAYAEQTAKRNAQAQKKDVWWRRYLMPLASAAALLVVGVVAWRASQEFDPDPGLIAIEMQKEREAKAEAAAPPAPAAKDGTPAAAAEPLAAPDPAQAAGPAFADSNEGAEDAKGGGGARKAAAPLADNRADAPAADRKEAQKEAKKAKQEAQQANKALAEQRAPTPDEDLPFKAPAPAKPVAERAKAKPQSKSRRDSNVVPLEKSVDDALAAADTSGLAGDKASGKQDSKLDVTKPEPLRDDWSNVAKRGALKPSAPVVTKAPASPPKVEPEPAAEEAPKQQLSMNQRAPGNQAVWGLGTGGTSSAPSGSGSSLGGLSTATPSAGRQAEVAGEVAQQGKESSSDQGSASKKKAASPKAGSKVASKTEEQVAQAVTPPPPPAAQPAPAPASSAPPTKGSYSLKGLGTSAGGSYGDAEDEAVGATDALSANREADYRERTRAELRQKNLESARAAGNRSDRVSEVKFALEVLSTGAKGAERLEALKRVCDAYEAMGEYDRADPYCTMLVKEFPSSTAAQLVVQRRNRVQKAPAPAKRAVDRPVDFDAESVKEDAKPAEAAPAQAY